MESGVSITHYGASVIRCDHPDCVRVVSFAGRSEKAARIDASARGWTFDEDKKRDSCPRHAWLAKDACA